MSNYEYSIAGRTIHLASIVTPKRISEFCTIFGKKKLSELIIPGADKINDTASGMNRMLLDAMGDADLAHRILCTCTDAEISLEEAAEVDSEIIGRIATDFFLLLIVKYFRQPK
ncbi:MAG: hypothetical protein HUU02_03830 [Bacteroidetes bacterium]|nr:hypothetical protein [Bacteroidota bacterium]